MILQGFIDFGETAQGHVFRDFAALEASVRLTCCNVVNLSALQRAADRAVSVSSLGDHIEYRAVDQITTNHDLEETLRMSMQIRRAALDAVGDKSSAASLKEYLFALVFHMLRYAMGKADEVSPDEAPEIRRSRVWHALYSAATAAQRVKDLP